jgi:RHS repeat-associated protein
MYIKRNDLALITYNRDGAMAKVSDTVIQYHAYHRMPVRVNGSSLRYNSRGMRTRKSGRSYRGHGIEIVEAANGEETCFVISPNGLVYMRAGSVSVPMTRNRQQSVCACGDTLVQYAPYGDFAAGGDTLPRRMYTGYEYDKEWGMYNARKRLYAPDLRVFVSVDPKFQFSSPYLYCMSDPFNNLDPTGEMSASGIVNIIINALTIVASIVVTVLTWGAATPEVIAADEAVAEAETGVTVAERGVELAEGSVARFSRILTPSPYHELRYSNDPGYRYVYDNFARDMARAEQNRAEKMLAREEAEATLKSTKRAARNARLAQTAKNVGITAAAGTALGGPASLTAKAASGEHISSYNAVNDVLIQPLIAVIGMAVGTGVGIGITTAAGKIAAVPFGEAAKMLSTRLASYTIGAAVGATAAGTISSAANKQDMLSDETWENIAVGVAVAAGAAIVTAAAPSVINGMARAGRWVENRFSSSESVVSQHDELEPESMGLVPADEEFDSFDVPF